MTGTGDERGTNQAPPWGWPTPPPPPPRNRTAIIAAVVVGAVLVVACFGVAGGVLVVRALRTDTAGSVTEARGGPSPSVSAEPVGSAEPLQEGPQASAYPAEEINDLNRVCDENVYYPELPKRAGKPPHPVVLLIADGSGTRYQNSTYYYSQGLAKKVEESWAAEDPRKVQMVACLDRVSTGAKIRGCRFDDPKPQTVSLVAANWRLRVYEAATGRKLLDKPMAGDDRSCPYVVLVRADNRIYAQVSNRAVVAVLRNLVNR